MTFAELFETYIERHARENLATWDVIQRKVRKDALPIIGQMPAGRCANGISIKPSTG
jgi:hypothetical protein